MVSVNWARASEETTAGVFLSIHERSDRVRARERESI